MNPSVRNLKINPCDIQIAFSKRTEWIEHWRRRRRRMNQVHFHFIYCYTYLLAREHHYNCLALWLFKLFIVSGFRLVTEKWGFVMRTIFGMFYSCFAHVFIRRYMVLLLKQAWIAISLEIESRKMRQRRCIYNINNNHSMRNILCCCCMVEPNQHIVVTKNAC